MSFKVPHSFREKVIRTFGPHGETWLSTLPTEVNKYIELWKLTPNGQFHDLSFNFVMPVKLKNGMDAVLKLGAHPEGRRREVNALSAFSGNGAIQVLASDPQNGVALLERATPGHELKQTYLNGNDARATEIACSVIEKLNHATTQGDQNQFKHVKVWGEGFSKFLNSGASEVSELSEEVQSADQIFHQLIRTADREVVLHGDLHHSNILSARREPWLAIDPKGVYGDPAYEVGAFIRNPMPEIAERADLEELLHQRVMTMSKLLGYDIQRIWGWSYSQAILAALWSIEDGNNDWRLWIRIARALKTSSKV